MAPKGTVLDGQAELDLGLPTLPRMAWPEPGEVQRAPLPTGGLDGFSTSVFAQVYTSDYATAARLVGYTGVGAVLTLRGTGPRWDQALGPVSELRRRTRTRSLLVDASEYSGKNRKTAEAGIDAEWNMEQHRYLDLSWALTNSGYAATLGHVRKLIHDGADLPGQSITAVPIPSVVLRDEAPTIAWLAREQGHPIALLLEDERDPFDDRDVVHAIAHVIEHAGNPVLLLRSDVSALGAISHGAVVGAVGAAGLRHIYPQLDGDGWLPPTAFVIPELLGYYLQTRFDKAYLRDPGHHAWVCSCWFCGGRSLIWIENQPKELIARSVISHSVSALAQIAERLARHANPAAGWTDMCATAEALHLEIANPSGSPWDPKPALAHWQTLTPALVQA